MNAPTESPLPSTASRFDSRDSVNVVIDQPGDSTVRPPRPHNLRRLLAERERLAKLQELMQISQTEDGGASSVNGSEIAE